MAVKGVVWIAPSKDIACSLIKSYVAFTYSVYGCKTNIIYPERGILAYNLWQNSFNKWTETVLDSNYVVHCFGLLLVEF